MRHNIPLSKLKQRLPLLATILLICTTTVSVAKEQSQTVKESRPDSSASTRPAVIYKAPLSDEPEAETDKSSKDKPRAILQILAPDHTGLTLQPQPSLYWHTDKPLAVRFTITAANKPEAKPLLKIDLKKSIGIQHLDLADHGITLKPDVSYQWSVSQLMDKESKSEAAITSGMIQYVKPGEGLENRINRLKGTQQVKVYAIEGIWYDALHTISSMIDESPKDGRLAAIRQSLLEQAGLQIKAE